MGQAIEYRDEEEDNSAGDTEEQLSFIERSPTSISGGTQALETTPTKVNGVAVYYDDDDDSEDEDLSLLDKNHGNRKAFNIAPLNEYGDSKKHQNVVGRYHVFEFSLALNLGFVLFLLFGHRYHDTTRSSIPPPPPQIDTNTSTLGWNRPDVVYGLVHMAKTAGSEINGMLANHYERVCGNKGYSYDALETNERMKNSDVKKGKKMTHADLGDAVSELYPGRNRGRPPGDFRDEIGYDDCDYIAMEHEANVWKQFSSKWKMELHVPCRDPLNHLMSQCNHFSHKFRCDAPDLEKEVETCTIFMERFKKKLLHDPNITLKCFDPVPPSRYVDYMGTILQRKRIESVYFHRDTNKPRNKEKECIWKESPEFQERVRNIMVENHAYYQYCNDCLGSSDELPLSQ